MLKEKAIQFFERKVLTMEKDRSENLKEVCSNLGFDVTKVIKDYNSLDCFSIMSTHFCANVIDRAIKKGYIDKSKIKSVCDFGSGTGMPLVVLKNAFQLTNGQLIALEQSEALCKEILKLNILKDSEVKMGDGIKYLESGKRKFDLITSCCLGPLSLESDLFKKLLLSASKSLTNEGKLLIYSDIVSMDLVEHTCKFNKIKYFKIEQEGLYTPTSIIISVDELSKIKNLILKRGLIIRCLKAYSEISNSSLKKRLFSNAVVSYFYKQ